MKPRRVVLVDDEADVTVFLQTALEDAGYTALAASSPAEGFALIKSEKPDLVCLDILMPEESGFSLYQRIRSDPELTGIPVLITTGLSPGKDLRNIDYLLLPDGSRLPEPDGFVEKPIDIGRFLAKVRKVLE
jgi:CheY-like chemotaxis protein